MPRIDAYDANKMAQIIFGTVNSATVDAAKDLILTKYSGATENIGNVKGPQGDKGPQGSSSQPAWDALPDFVPTPWTVLDPLVDLLQGANGPNWDHYSPSFAPFRYRLVGDVVELDGCLEYIGDNLANPNALFSTTLPDEIGPNNVANDGNGRWRYLRSMRNGRYECPFYVYFLGPGNGCWMGMTGAVGTPNIETGDRFVFSGISYHLSD